ncbi:227 kDa spindle- and centromere-associated protein isoform X9 [Eurosta solidaginis]|uniref:227 kDa spindle- and centromere-associated protein isoform X9 n=2 Tax=Eurosta solidaginis TaxID=178769 RepID=UPI003530A43A
MDIFSLYDWITSLLRPRGHLQPLEHKQSEPIDPATVVETTEASDFPTSQQQPTEKVELIPTLDFVIHKPAAATELDFQHVNDILRQLQADTHDAQADNDADSNHSGHTYIIERHSDTSSSTNTEDLLRQEIIRCCRTNETTEPSLYYEPTGSIAIEMYNLGKSGATTATTTAATTTPTRTTTTDEVPAESTDITTSRKNSNTSAITSNTTKSSSEEQSIEEEIEEAIEISEEDVPISSAAHSTELSEAAGYIKPSSKQKGKKEHEIQKKLSEDTETAEDDSFGQQIRNIAAKGIERKQHTNQEENELFKIDDDQLSGGKLAQHFILADEEDDARASHGVPLVKAPVHSRHVSSSEGSVPISKSVTDSVEVDFGDVDVSLPLEKRVPHSRHEESLISNFDGVAQQPSLGDESTANDVSELLEEVRQGADSLKSEELQMPVAEKTQTSVEHERRASQTSFSKSSNSKEHKESASKKDDIELKKRLTAGSPEHGEKDNSIDEIVERSHSFEYTFDERDLSSLNPSFLAKNASLVNRLLTDTIEEHEPIEKNTSANSTSVDPQLRSTEMEDKSGISPRLITDLDVGCGSEVTMKQGMSTEASLVAHKQQQSTLKDAKNKNFEETEYTDRTLLANNFKERNESNQNVPLHENKTLETKLATISETFPLQGMAAVEVETLETCVEHIEDDESSTFDTDALRAALQNLLGSKLQVTSVSPELEAPNSEEEDDDDTSMNLMKLRILAMKQQSIIEQQQTTTSTNEAATMNANASTAGDSQQIKPMERVPLGDALEDITEESERYSLSTAEEHRSLSMERSATSADVREDESKTMRSEHTAHELKDVTTSSGVVSLNMLQMLEHKVTALQDMVSGKDACLAALNLQLETAQRRESSGAYTTDQLGSGRDTNSSLITSSTEYRTIQEEFGGPTTDLYVELSRRDELIAKLTDSLQQSINVREQLQAESDKLTNEVQALRKQLTDALDTLRRPNWPRTDLDSNCGQRISEISIDLISESDDDLERQFFTDNEDKYSRNSRERQLSVPRQQSNTSTDLFGSGAGDMEPPEWQQPPFSKQIEQFQKYLNPGEVRLFFMVQKKFDDYLSQELEKYKMKSELEQKDLIEQLELEKKRQEAEVSKLTTTLEEQSTKHAKEVEELRKYFETKCAEFEKQFSDDVFSHKSQNHTGDTSSSEGSDQEQMPEEIAPASSVTRCKDTSPRKRTRAELLLSPSHRQITPFADVFNENENSTEIAELKTFYQQKLHEFQRTYDEKLRKVTEKLKYYENRYPDDEFMTLLSDSTTDDQHWPPELILLREKFTAKSQLKIAQLKIKHEEEMSRLKLDYEKQLNRKNKRHSTFDSARDFDQIISDRDNLRELCKTFRSVLAELAKCVANCEDDLNATLMQEVHRLVAHNRTLDEQIPEVDVNLSLLNASFNSTKQSRFIPDVQSLLEVVEDPSLVDFVSNKSGGDLAEEFDLRECLERLNAEALYLLKLSEDLHKRQKGRLSSLSSGMEKIDSCCEGDSEGEKSLPSRGENKHRFIRTGSLNEQQLPTYREHTKDQQAQLLTSLPPDLNRLRHEQAMHNNDDVLFSSTTGGNASELNFQVHELRNRLVKSESDRVKLQEELENTIKRNAELGQELQALRDQLSQLNSPNQTDFSEGYGHGSLRSPPRVSGLERSSTSFTQLQEKARNILSSPTQQQPSADATVVLLQMIEDFCREGEKVMECGKKDREDLQAQVEYLEAQIRELTQKLADSNAKREKFEIELKASIDKIFVLREIITELETQVETKALNEQVLAEKNRQLEDYINSQTRSNETLQNEVQSLKLEIGVGYQERIRLLEEKLQNMRPSAEQSMVLDQVVEQLRDIENLLDQKTKNLESIHHSISSNANSATEDVSVNGTRPQPTPMHESTNNPTTALPTLGSPLHPSPRQHSLTMEGVQRIADKVAKHTRVEEAAIKRIRDLEMQVTQMRDACVELQHERDSLQDRMSEQNQRISTLQSRLEEQRKLAMELQRAGSTDFNVRIHDLQTEVHNLRETLSVRDKKIATMKQQLEKSKEAMDRLEAELAVQHQPDRSVVERLEAELKQKNSTIQLLKEKIKNEMINKLALPDLMETMLADKNEEIDHLREQLESKEKEIQKLNSSQASSLGGGDDGAKSIGAGKDEASTKLSARTLSDIVSISEFDEPGVMRRAAVAQEMTPLQLPQGDYRAMGLDTSKQVVANLTHKRTEDLSGFAVATLRPVNTFENPHYFQDPNVLTLTGQSTATATPPIVPRQINFSSLTEDSKLKTPGAEPGTPKKLAEEKEMFEKLQQEVKELKEQLLLVSTEKERAVSEKDKVVLEKGKVLSEKIQEIQAMEEELVATQVRLGGLQHELEQRQSEIDELKKAAQKCAAYQTEIAEKTAEIELLLSSQELLTKENKEQQERLTKSEKELLNYKENEQRLQKRIKELKENLLQTTKDEVNERESLRKELQALALIHEQCKNTVRELEKRKQESAQLNEQLKAKEQRLQMLTNKLLQADEKASELQEKIKALEEEVERLRQQPNSDNSSKQYSVDEIAQQVEKELNYSVQLDSNILRAIESEEENNLDRKSREKATQEPNKTEAHGTDDENFTGERDLLNQLEVLKTQIAVEREQSEEIRKELLLEKQHSQEIQEQDVLIIEAMRKRLETALEKEDELHKQLDIERERCERVQTQLTAMQRAESRRNSVLLKSPTDSPRKSPRALANDFESELAERLRSEIKMLTAQNERERERCADTMRAGERERQRYENELQERIEYCDKLKREMEKQARDKDSIEQECEHLQERLTLQTQEIESLEARLATLQEAETRRTTRRDRQQKESAQLLGEIQEVKGMLLSTEAERDNLVKNITQLRFEVERAAQREAKLAEALANANMAAAETSVPQQFLQKMKEINALLAENTQENRQMAETVQFLVEERRQLQKRCEELEGQMGGTATVAELEERCNHLLGRYLRVESHRKALVYQKRYLKISLQSYQESEQRALTALNGGRAQQMQRNKNKLFKTVALAVVAIQRMKFIGRSWRTGKRIVSKSVFTITQQKPMQTPTLLCGAAVAAASSSCPKSPSATQYFNQPLNGLRQRDRQYQSLKSPALVHDCMSGIGFDDGVSSTTATTTTNLNPVPIFDWPRLHTFQQ